MLIINSTIINWGTPHKIVNGSAVLVIGSEIARIDSQNILLQEYPDEEILDAKGQFLFPGVICAHTHFYGAFSRGMAIYGEPPKDFPEILEKLWWPLDRSLQPEDIRYSALVCMIDAIKHGTTTLFDHHASANSINGSLDIIEDAFSQTGLRGSVCYEVSDRDGFEKAEQGIEENIRMINKHESGEINELVVPLFGLHASLTLSDETLEKCRKVLHEKYGVHIHVAEHSIDETDSLRKSGMRVVHRLNKYDFLGERSLVVHGVHLDDDEIADLSKTKTWVSHQPRSNMNNAVGMADIEKMNRLGIKVCIGNDGFSNNMWEEWKTCYLVHKLWNQDPRSMNGASVIEMGAINNSLLASSLFGKPIGRIEVGFKADLILVDYHPITDLTPENLPWHILFGFRDSMVTTTIVNGNILMKDKQLVSINENEISERSRELSKEVWKRYNAQF